MDMAAILFNDTKPLKKNDYMLTEGQCEIW